MGSTVSKHLHLVWAESQFIQSFVKFSPKLGSDFVKITQILTSIFFPLISKVEQMKNLA